MERNGYGNGMETELQNMTMTGKRNDRETANRGMEGGENRGIEGGENIGCKGMEIEEYQVYLVPPLTWWNTLFAIPVFFWYLIVHFLFDLLVCLPLVIYALFAYLTGRSYGWFPFHLTRECFIYPLLKGEWYGSYYHNFPETTRVYSKEPITFGSFYGEHRILDL